MLCAAFILVLSVFNQHVAGLNNGLSLTPPMGWLAWQRFRCNTDCENDPNYCIRYDIFLDQSIL